MPLRTYTPPKIPDPATAPAATRTQRKVEIAPVSGVTRTFTPPSIADAASSTKRSPPKVEIQPGKDVTIAPIGAVKQLAESLQERLFNQARRIVPPAIVLDKVVRTLDQGRTALPKKVPPSNGPMGKLAAQKLTRLEIHMLLDRSDLSYQNLDSGDPKWITVMMNPEEVVHSLKVRRADMAVPGRVGSRRQYLGTENEGVTFKCVWDAFIRADDAKTFDANVNGVHGVKYARKFLQAMTMPSNGENGLNGSPPRFLFFWANYCSLTCDVDSITFKDNKFAPDGTLWGFEASFDLKEVGDIQLSLETVMRQGLQRTKVEPPSSPRPSGDLGSSGNSRLG